MNRVVTKLGPLQCTVVDALEEGQEPTALAVLCHGYGAPGTDLVPLGGEIFNLEPDLKKGLRFVFPQAPLGGGRGPRFRWSSVEGFELIGGWTFAQARRRFWGATCT